MEQYQNLVQDILQNGSHETNRTKLDTIVLPNQSYTVDISDKFPLLTTKDLRGPEVTGEKLDGTIWESLVAEFMWYLSGDEHVRWLSEYTGVWDKWKDETGMLETAYPRFWRRYPQPRQEHMIDGENWATEDTPWVNEDGTIDQLDYITHQLENDPHTRRMIINAWHPANATTSLLPPCHVMYICTVCDGKLYGHLTQRSGDTALGVPFNIAAYSLLTKLLANQTEYEAAQMSHTIVDAHIYCGTDSRADWYDNNLQDVQKLLENNQYSEAKQLIENNAPEEEIENADHVPGLLEQLTREPRTLPTISLSDDATVNNFSFNHIELQDYNPHPRIGFYVAE